MIPDRRDGDELGRKLLALAEYSARDETDPAGDGTYDGDDDGYPPAHEYDGPHYDTPAPQS